MANPARKRVETLALLPLIISGVTYRLRSPVRKLFVSLFGVKPAPVHPAYANAAPPNPNHPSGP